MQRVIRRLQRHIDLIAMNAIGHARCGGARSELVGRDGAGYGDVSSAIDCAVLQQDREGLRDGNVSVVQPIRDDKIVGPAAGIKECGGDDSVPQFPVIIDGKSGCSVLSRCLRMAEGGCRRKQTRRCGASHLSPFTHSALSSSCTHSALFREDSNCPMGR